MVEIILSLLVGLGLSAACGFRVFVPLLIAAIAARTGHLELGEGFAWMGSDIALIALGAATLGEILGYYLPVVDHFLDLVGAPAAAIAGILLTASFASDMSPWFQWSVAVIAGGGIATLTHAGMATVRGAVSSMSASLGNPIVSTTENVVATGMAGFLAFLPMIGIGLVSLVLIWMICVLWKKYSARKAQSLCFE